MTDDRYLNFRKRIELAAAFEAWKERKRIELAAASTKAVDENYLSARLQIDTIRNALDCLIVDMTAVRDGADRGDPIRADFRHSCKKLETALDYLDASTERLI